MSFPRTGILDSFTRANENPINVATNGVTWLTPADGIANSVYPFQLVSNALACNNTTALNNNYLNATYGPNVEASITLTALGVVATTFDIGVRVSGLTSILTPSGYGIRLATNVGTDDINLLRIDSGAITVLASYGQEMSVNDSFGISAIGNVLTAYYKAAAGSWTVLGSTTDNTYTAAGTISLTQVSNSITSINLVGGTVPNGGMALMGVG